MIYNSSYQQIATVRAGNGYRADLHEILLTPQGTAWIDAFDPIHINLSSVHGSAHGILLDSIIEEVDIKTGLVMWEWHALGHIPLGDSLNHVSSGEYPWDYVHINSISPGGTGSNPGGTGSGEPGNVMLSARNTWTLYDVNMHTGGYNWLLGDGGHSSFKLSRGVRFYWQHDAEFQPGGLVSLFNNASDPPKERESSGLLLRPDFSNHTVTLVKRFVNPSKTLLASSQGDTLSLPGGDWLLGYGGLPNFTEFNSSGHVLLDGTLGKNVQDFRTYLFSVERPAEHRAGDRRAGRGGRRDASRRAGTAPPTSPPGRLFRARRGAVPVLSGKPRAAHHRAARRLSDDDPGERRRRQRRSRRGRSQRRGRCWGRPPRSPSPDSGTSPTAGRPPRGALPDSPNGLSGPCSPSSRRSRAAAAPRAAFLAVRK